MRYIKVKNARKNNKNNFFEKTRDNAIHDFTKFHNITHYDTLRHATT
jgi:hypothetical protein